MNYTPLRCLLLLSSATMAQTWPNRLSVNQQRIDARLVELAKFGPAPGGLMRVAYSKAPQEGRAYFIGLMRKAGLTVTIDFAGNIIGRRRGKNPALKPIGFGSHIDTVPNGGNYDGRVGSIGGLELIETPNDNLTTEHPLELLIFANEEGMPNHAGTTPINRRRDAMLAPAKLTVALNDGITSHEGRQVGTVGKMAVEPGAYTGIPGKVVPGMEIRDLNYEKIRSLFREVESRAKVMTKASGTTITFCQPLTPVTPALTAKPIQDKYQYGHSSALLVRADRLGVCTHGA